MDDEDFLEMPGDIEGIKNLIGFSGAANAFQQSQQIRKQQEILGELEALRDIR